VKNSKTGNFALCNPLKIQVGARHGVPLRGFFTPSTAWVRTRDLLQSASPVGACHVNLHGSIALQTASSFCVQQQASRTLALATAARAPERLLGHLPQESGLAARQDWGREPPRSYSEWRGCLRALSGLGVRTAARWTLGVAQGWDGSPLRGWRMSKLPAQSVCRLCLWAPSREQDSASEYRSPGFWNSADRDGVG
jgi:hypothetical protein